MVKKLIALSAAAIVSLTLAGFAEAYSTFFGEDLGQGESVRLTSHVNADTARDNFLSSLVGVGTETFESYGTGTTAPLAISFSGAGTATINGTGSIATVPTGTNGFGRYPISGNNYWQGTNSFYIDFSDPVAAFGFYGIDIGDFSGNVTLTLLSGETKTINIENTLNGDGGGVLYFGIIDTEDPFKRVTFGNTAAGTDVFAFDDMTIGSVEQVRPPGSPVPEPSTMLLFGAGMAGLAFWRRKKSA